MTAPLLARPDRARSAPAPRGFVPARGPELSVVAPTYNERPNIRPLFQALAAALDGIAWELIVVDDDSPDGTHEVVLALARDGAPVRCLRRVGRRGLSSAVVEGCLGANADVVAVIDADGQHDETRLPDMLGLLRATGADIVVGSRHIEGGGLGDWGAGRRRMSALATRLSRALVGTRVSDPMSGFFVVRRPVIEETVHDLSQHGYKILLDILASSRRPLRVEEVGYVFRDRRAGDSKVDAMVLAEFGLLLVEKLTRGLIPPRFVLFCLVGGLGLMLHLAVLRLGLAERAGFLHAQALATLAAMSLNFTLNNALTYRRDRLRGWRLLRGYLLFCALCSVGAVANVGVASLAWGEGRGWALAGIAGAVMSAVFNFGAATGIVWRRPRQRRVRPVR